MVKLDSLSIGIGIDCVEVSSFENRREGAFHHGFVDNCSYWFNKYPLKGC